MKQEKRTPTVVRRRDDAPRAEAPRTSTVRRRADAPSGGSGVKGKGINQWVTAGFAAFSVLVVIGVIGALIAPDREEDPAALSSPSGITRNSGDDLRGAGLESAAPTPTPTPSGPPENGTYTLPCGMEFQFWDEVRNDVTGRWRRAATSDSFVPADCALEYYEMMHYYTGEIHSVWNATLQTTTSISASGGLLFVDTYEYVKGEEHDAKIMFSGKLLDSRIISIETGEPIELEGETPEPQPSATPAPEPKETPKPTKNTNSAGKDRRCNWSSGSYLGSSESDKYHDYECRAAKAILPENEVWFSSEDSAKAAGYSRCGICW